MTSQKKVYDIPCCKAIAIPQMRFENLEGKVSIVKDKETNLLNITLVNFSKDGEYLGFVKNLQKGFKTFEAAEQWGYKYSKEMNIPLDNLAFREMSFGNF